MIYLDNAATTFPKSDFVYDTMDRVNRSGAVNAGRGSYKLAQNANKLIDETKMQLRNLVNAEADTPVVFSSSITIAINQIIYGVEWKHGDVIYLSPYEHNAVVRPIHIIEEKYDVSVKVMPIKPGTLEIDLEKLKYMFSLDEPTAVFCTGISNVTGYILPIEEIFNASKEYGAVNVLDAAQLLGLLEVDVKRLAVDFVTFAGHKSLYGPFGIGGFINITHMKLLPLLAGGTGSDSLNMNMPLDEETQYEPASTNIVAIAGLNAALTELNVSNNYKEEKNLTEYAIAELSKVPKIKMFVPDNSENHIGIISFVFEGWKSDEVGKVLDLDFDIAVRTGFHCAPLIHSYLKDEANIGTVRVGIGIYNSKNDIDALVSALREMEW